MNADTLAAAQARHAKGESPTQIAKALGFPALPSTGTWPSSSTRTAGHLAPGRSFGSPGPCRRVAETDEHLTVLADDVVDGEPVKPTDGWA
jgi:hypothetical protein